jgi:predicted metal-dependent hydrolase
MEHVLYSDGNAKRISWTIKTDSNVVDQSREHAEIFLDQVTDLQSKYVALHVGLFWSIGVFIVKNGDTVRIMLDSDEMISHLSGNMQSQDRFAESRKGFINQLAEQRNLKLEYEKIIPQDNISTKML